MTIDWMKGVKEANPDLYENAKMDLFVVPWKAGEDRISRGRPASFWPMRKRANGPLLRRPRLRLPTFSSRQWASVWGRVSRTASLTRVKRTHP